MNARSIVNFLAASDKLTLVAVGFVLSLVMVVLYIFQPPFIQFFDYKVYDQLLAGHHTTESSNRVVIVDIDEASLTEYGQWPWPRYRVALMLGTIRKAGGLAVGLDILFAERDRTSPAVLKEELRRDLGVDVGFTGLPEALMDNDEVLARVVASGPFVPAFYLRFGSGSGRSECGVEPLEVSLLSEPGAPGPRQALRHASGMVCPLPELARTTNLMGYYNTVTDLDGIIRKVPLLASLGDDIYPGLSLATLMRAFGKKSLILKLNANGAESLKVAGEVVPLDQHGQLWLNYLGPAGSFPYVSAHDVLQGKFAPETFENKIVLVGTSAAGLQDIRATPLGADVPGVEIHATVLNNILTQNYVKRPDWVPGLEVFTIVAAGLFASVLLAYSRALWVVAPLAVLAGGMWFGSGYVFSRFNIYLSPLYSYLVLALNFAVLTLIKFWREEGQKRFLHATFQSYLSPELIERMVSSQTMPELGGEARVITAFFTDIQSFSTFSEKLTAHQLVELLNEYLSAMTDILINEGGTLDKYEGDAIVAFFGAPLNLPDHGLRACRTAVAQQHRLLELREKWKSEKRDPDEPERNTKNLPPDQWAPNDKWPVIVHRMLTRIGINSGEIVVGNMGSSMRMNYTMMGDSVNLAARLEEGAKQYGVYTLVSEYTLSLPCSDEAGAPCTVADMVEARFIDNIQVVGKEEPVKVFELCAMKGGLSDTEKELFKRFDTAMEHYLAMRWDEAARWFAAALEVERVPEGKTTPSEVFLKRCEQFKNAPPVAEGESWDGVYRLTSK